MWHSRFCLVDSSKEPKLSPSDVTTDWKVNSKSQKLLGYSPRWLGTGWMTDNANWVNLSSTGN